MPEQSQFLFITCQVGAEPALKRELAKYRPSFRFAYSRPGFLTFKLPEKHGLKDDFDLKAIFARAYGFSLGKVAVPESFVCTASLAPTLVAPAEEVWKLAAGREFEALHVWPRDRFAPGQHDFEVAQTAESYAADLAIRAAAPEQFAALKTKQPTQKGDRVLDVVLVDANLWWVGFHRADGLPTRRPGGIFEEIGLPDDAVSRAYLKLEEGLAWSGLPVEPDDHAAEIGCAPGGACQALLNRGLLVTGIDPAEMDAYVAGHPNFRHLRMRGSDVKRREFSGVKWLMTDMNVAPNYTLDTVEAIVTHPDVHIEGMLLTLKLLDWEQADDAAEYVSRVQSWGFGKVHCRQLQHNRREFCLAAERKGAPAPLEKLEERATRKLAKIAKSVVGAGSGDVVVAKVAAKPQAEGRPEGAPRKSNQEHKRTKKERTHLEPITGEQDELTQEQLDWNNRDQGESKPAARPSKSKEIFAAKKKMPVPVPKSTRTLAHPTPGSNASRSFSSRPSPSTSSSAAKTSPAPATATPPAAAPPQYKLGLKRKEELNAKEPPKPIAKLGAQGVKRRPKPIQKKKRG
ncbi:MAG: hypothetical protein K8U03_23330 [Planctomycetia bacterium]|nr:hypothetical protein [Planctomycetia bacterium]